MSRGSKNRLVAAAWLAVAVPGLMGGRAAHAAGTPVTVSGAWAWASLPGQDGGVAYLTIAAPAGDTLLSVSSPDAARAMLHQTTRSGGMSSMEDVDSLPIPAGTQVTLSPGGTHIMLMGLHHALTAGGTVALQLHFANAGKVEASATVRAITR